MSLQRTGRALFQLALADARERMRRYSFLVTLGVAVLFSYLVCTGKIKHTGSTYLDQWNYLKKLLPADRVKEAKLTLPAPEWYHLRYQPGKAYSKDVYANDEEYFADIAIAYQAELQELHDNGVRNVTIDDPNLACKATGSPRGQASR